MPRKKPDTPVDMKKGRMGAGDIHYIVTHAHTDEPEAIAKHLGRTVPAVLEAINRHKREAEPPATASEAEERTRLAVRQELRTSLAWKQLKDEFTKVELAFFEESYVKLMTQFKNDVMASEETQVFQVVKFEILMHRNLSDRRRARDDIDRLERIQKDFLVSVTPGAMSDTDKEFAVSLETQLASARSAEQSKTTEYTRLQERHADLLKGLKAVRDQRIKEIETSKINFLGVIKRLAQKDIAEREGRQLALMKLAGEKAYVDLGRPHRFDDGNEDSPILSAETVDLGPAEEDEDGEDS